MTGKEFEKLANANINTLRRMDIQRGLIDENFEPCNGWLSAKENKRCWEYLAEQFVKDTQYGYLAVFGVTLGDNALYKGWLSFLQDVNNTVKCGDREAYVKSIINASGISEETWVRFLD